MTMQLDAIDLEPIKRGPGFLNLVGQRFGRLVVSEFFGKCKSNASIWACQCDCGKKTNVSIGQLRSGKTKSCGCLRGIRSREIRKTHGDATKGSQAKEYRIWTHIKDRCHNPKCKQYHHYGGRGIKVCDRWKTSYKNFLQDMGRCPYGLEIDRINNDGDYEPSNCRWTTRGVNATNRRGVLIFNHLGKTLSLRAWSREVGMNYLTLYGRVVIGRWQFSDAIETPVRKITTRPNAMAG